MLLGWDGLGVTSYLLVIYYQREKSFNAGIITALTNRLGDVALLLVIGLSFYSGSWGYYFYSWGALDFSLPILLVLVLATITKRAQIPFSSWLPAAIAAPTPVSALVHSSTLVTAGVYVLIRINYVLLEVGVGQFLSFLGACTMWIAGMSAMGELDIKKVIALSTLSQLGLMFITLGLGLPTLAFFHLAAHAYFKAILFMCAGSIIHRIKDYQDIRTMGQAVSSLPVSAAVVIVSNLRLCGIPFMSGFYSKDLILELLLISKIRLALFFLAIVSTALTVMYS